MDGHREMESPLPLLQWLAGWLSSLEPASSSGWQCTDWQWTGASHIEPLAWLSQKLPPTLRLLGMMIQSEFHMRR